MASKQNQETKSLYAALSEYGESDYYPYHMPGHKRSRQAGEMAGYFDIDITEIDGFDDLHHAEGILREAQERANRLYGAEETYYLVGGSTCGILASIMTAAARGTEILIARNCHKSVYHAAILQELQLHYCRPAVLENYGIYDGIGAEEIGCLLEQYPACKAVVITSPTYEGILSDIEAIAAVVHARDKILIVDEAHGAHLGLDPQMPAGAVAAGADLVIHSLHKTLPAMTQTALVHVQGERVDRDRLRRYLRMLQTSSPSYVMMASMDCCVRYMETQGTAGFTQMRCQHALFCKKTETCKHIIIGKMTDVSQNDGHCGEKHTKLFTGTSDGGGMLNTTQCRMAGWDIGKLVILIRNDAWNGQKLYDVLREEYHLQMEMAAGNYVLAVMTIMDTEEGWQRLADALVQIDDRIEREAVRTADEKRRLCETEPCAAGQITAARGSRAGVPGVPEDIDGGDSSCGMPEVRMCPAQACEWPREKVPLTAAAGRIAADFINLYPPGIPLLVPGEVISESLLVQMRESIRMGLRVQGVDEGAVSVLL